MTPGPTNLSPSFRRLASDVEKGLVIKPLIRSYLLDARFPEHFTVSFRKHSLDHGPDGWFHPSTHPLWAERQLWYYIKHPESFISEVKEYMGVMSITMGTAIHDFMALCLQEAGALMVPPGPCSCGDPDCNEWYTEDPVLRSRGHMDGRSSLEVPGYEGVEVQNFEFKTITSRATLPPDLDLDWLKRKHPRYYAQQQEYMRMTGISLTIILFMAMGYPWEMVEIHIPFDPGFSKGVATKYRNVLAAVDADVLPPPCCAPGSATSKECPFRSICPVGMQS